MRPLTDSSTIKVGVILNPSLSPRIPVSELGSSEITILSTIGGSKSTLINIYYIGIY